MPYPTVILPQATKYDATCRVGHGWVEQVYVQSPGPNTFTAANRAIMFSEDLVDVVRLDVYQVDAGSLVDVDFLVGLGAGPSGGWEAGGKWQPTRPAEPQGLLTIVRGIPAQWCSVFVRTTAIATVYLTVTAYLGRVDYDVSYGPLVKPGP